MAKTLVAGSLVILGVIIGLLAIAVMLAVQGQASAKTAKPVKPGCLTVDFVSAQFHLEHAPRLPMIPGRVQEYAQFFAALPPATPVPDIDAATWLDVPQAKVAVILMTKAGCVVAPGLIKPEIYDQARLSLVGPSL